MNIEKIEHELTQAQFALKRAHERYAYVQGEYFAAREAVEKLSSQLVEELRENYK